MFWHHTRGVKLSQDLCLIPEQVANKKTPQYPDTPVFSLTATLSWISYVARTNNTPREITEIRAMQQRRLDNGEMNTHVAGITKKSRDWV
jgi:hypothetical protein